MAVDLGHSFDFRRVRVTAVVAGFLSIAFLFAVHDSEDAALWMRRNVLLSQEAWPRRTHFVLERADGEWHVARREPLRIEAWVVGDVPPEVLFKRVAEGKERTLTLGPEAEAPLPDRVLEVLSPDVESQLPFDGPRARIGQRVVHVTGRITEPFDFFLSGGDNRSPRVRVFVHDRPRLVSWTASLEFPEYLAREAETVENAVSELVVPEGGVIHAVAEFDLPLAEASAAFSEESLDGVAIDGQRAILEGWTPLSSGTLALVGVEAEWGLSSSPSLRVGVVVVPDEPPRVDLELLGASHTVTPRGTVR